ncbi:MAG: 16S rRNA (cytidine(1402)-2'-O)-methyltransferase [Muribaculaceae bacterium]|nr:16S rRNA (cytidine(1402)-2'-O)-methyltransferase [Muribaculaceae bacterium]
MSQGCLFIVPTPIGNLEDMTFRAVKVLKEVDLILAEDTRTSGILLKHYDISTPMRSHHKFNEHESAPKIAQKIIEGEKIALISDAGTPGISDPGFFLVRECRKLGADVICLPGPTAFVPALVSSGLPCDKFVFEGFLPPKKGRNTRLSQLSEETRTIIIYESPKRLQRTLKDLSQFFGEDRPAAVCRELSKLHETINFSSLGQLYNYYSENQAKGEIVIVVAGNQIPGKNKNNNKDD